MAITGGSTIIRHMRRVAKLVGKHSAAGILTLGGTAPAVAALVLACEIFQALDAAGAFDGVMSGSFGLMDKQADIDPIQAMSMSRDEALSILNMHVSARKPL